MWPMLTSLLPFYNDGILGYFENAKNITPCSKKDGFIYSGDYNKSKNFIDQPIQYKIKPKYIFVLISERTTSSGEAVAISLKSLNNTIFIGTESGGFTTGNVTFKLSNGDKLILTGSYMLDDKKQRYLPAIKPDYEISGRSKIEDFILRYIKEHQ